MILRGPLRPPSWMMRLAPTKNIKINWTFQSSRCFSRLPLLTACLSANGNKLHSPHPYLIEWLLNLKLWPPHLDASKTKSRAKMMFYHSRWSNDIGRRCVIRYCCIPYRSTIPNKNFLLASFILGRVAFLILPPSLLFFAPLDSSLCAYTQQQQQQHQQSTLIDLLQVAVSAAAFLINRKDDRERERKKEAKLIISLPLLLISSCHLGNMPTRPLRILWIGSNTREKEREEYKDVLPLIFQQPHSALILSSLPPFPRGTNFLYSTRSTLRRAYATQRHAMQCNSYTIRSTVVYCTYSNLHT